MPEQFPVLTDSGEIDTRPFYTVDEVADLFHTTKNTVYARMRSGEWPYIRIVRTVYFGPAEIQTIIERSTHADGTPGGLHRERGQGPTTGSAGGRGRA